MKLNPNQKRWLAWGIVAAVLTVITIALGVSFPVPPPPSVPVYPEAAPTGDVGAASSYFTPVYIEHGGKKLVVGSTGEIEIQSGATFDLQSGATTDFSSGIDLDGGLLDLDANGNTSIQADTDDQIDIEISGADDFQFTANTFSALSGSTIKANTIAETTTNNGVVIDSLIIKDGGISGNFVVTGTSDLQGSVYDSGGTLTLYDNTQITGTLDVLGNVYDSGGTLTLYDNTQITGTLDVLGNVYDSGGTLTLYDNTQITGTLDLLGALSDSGGDVAINDNVAITGTLDVQGGDVTLQNDETFSNSTNGVISATVDASGWFAVMTGNLMVGYGSPDLTLNGSDAFIAGTLEADGAVRFDSTLEVNSNITLQNDETISNTVDGVVAVNGEFGYLQYVVDKAASYTVQDGESGAMFSNDGASTNITFTLPAASEGLVFTFISQDNQVIGIDPDGSDQIFSETNGAGDAIQSSAQYDCITLVATGAGEWLPVCVIGTWNDVD